MKVGLLIYGSLDSVSGGYLYDRKLVEYLRKQGDTVEILSIPRNNYLRDILFPPDLESSLKAGFDVLVQDEWVHPSLVRINPQIRSQYRIPIVALVHLFSAFANRPVLQSSVYRLIERQYLKTVDAVIMNSRHTLKMATTLMNEHPLPPHIVAVPAGDNFPVDIADPALKNRSESTKLRILSVGNLIRQKGLLHLLDALEKADIEFELHICGRTDMEPDYTQTLRKRLSRACFRDRVTVHGPCERDSLARLYAASDVFVLPSVNEAYGIVYLEAQQFGLPTIGTTAGGAAEIIRDGINGYLVPPGDSTLLAERLSSLYRDRQLLNRLGNAARESYAAHPRWQDTCAGIRTFLLETIKHTRTQH